MSDHTGIEWTDATWNPVRGCSLVSEGCRNCYAMSVAARFSGPGQPYEGLARRRSNGEPQWTGEVRLIEKHLADPLRWQRPRRIFVNSMSDLFHEGLGDDVIARVFAVMALADRHTYQVLTKRPARMQQLLSSDAFVDMMLDEAEGLWGLTGRSRNIGPDGYEDWCSWLLGEDHWPLDHVWLGVSVEDQTAADERIPLLLETPAAIRFLSCEPLLGPTQLPPTFDGPGIDWCIVGGESGPHARPMHPDWARSLRDQCLAAGVSFFFKQWGEWIPCPYDEKHVAGRREREIDGAWMLNVGKRTAGRVLDGRTWDEYPAEAVAR